MNAERKTDEEAGEPGSRSCSSCGRAYQLWGLEVMCECGGPLGWTPGCKGRPGPGRGLWRYAELLPPVSPRNRLTLGEPETPILELGRLLCKLDYLMPTGSFKDRGAAVLASCALEAGVAAAVADSSGNAGAALAAYFGSAGVPITVFVPRGATSPKVEQARRYGADVVEVEGDRAAASHAARDFAASSGAFYASHARSPYFTAGTRTLAFELAEQVGPGLSAVVAPVGAGTVLLGLYEGFRALVETGAMSSVPPLVGVQAAACAPLADAYARGAALPDPARTWGSSVAGGINIVAPPRSAEVLEAVRATNGTITTVTEEQILEAQLELARTGVFVEATAAAAWAAATGAGVVPDDAVVVLTGSGLKEVL